MWMVITTDDFDDWFEGLTEPIREEIDATIQLLETLGPHLKRPHADTLNESKHHNMKELRVDEQGAVIRIAFAFDPDRQGVLLIAGNKAGVNKRKFYKWLIDKADRLYDDHLRKLKAAKKKGKK